MFRTRMPAAAVLAAGLALGGAALAESCPAGPAALDTGLTVQFDGMSVVYQRTGDGRIREVERYEDETGDWHYISDAIGLVHESWEVAENGVPDETTRDRFSYVFPKGAPQPRPGSEWTGTETVLTATGESYDTVVTWRMGAARTERIGGCVYDVIPIVETRVDLPKSPGDLPWINRYTHLSDLGLTMYLGGDEEGVEPFLDTPLGISAGLR